MKLSPTEIRAMASCPRCGAHRGESCRRSREHERLGWVRVANHQERVNEANEVTTR